MRIDGRGRRTVGRCVVEALEARVLFSGTAAPAFASISGAGNNVVNPTWGVAGTDLIRITAAAYGDGVSSPNLSGNLSARAISNLLNSQASKSGKGDVATVDANSLSDFGYAFGQFMDHDMDLTLDGGESFPISVAADDPIGPNALGFTRSQYDPATGTSAANPRQQTTMVTAYLDLSQVYGSDDATAAALRTMSGGRMKTSAGNLLPYLNSDYFTADQLAIFNKAAGGEQSLSGIPTTSLFATGDVRGNENLELTTLTTLFVRNHNLIAGKLAAKHPTWTDEQIYQEARKINIADYQNIVYNEWIPAVYGQKAISAYKGYNPGVNASISNEFSTVAFRFGHSMVSAEIERHGNNGADVADSVPLAFDFFDPNLLSATGTIDPYTGLAGTNIDAVLKGEADANGQAMDMMAVNDLRNLLFGNAGAGGEDLIARDIQRDRDNGIPDYNTLRVKLGLKPVTSFAQITSNVQVQQALAAAYPGGVNTIDAFEGGLAEDHVPGSEVGPLFQAIMIDQFTRLRDGDRFYYQNEHLNPEEMQLVQSGNSLTKVIEANTSITNLQANAMLFHAAIGGLVSAPGPRGTPSGLAGLQVQLLNADGEVVATTTTDGRGRYQFTQASRGASDDTVTSGVSATGSYSVVVIGPIGGTFKSSSISVASGDTNVGNADVKLPPPPAAAHAPARPRARARLALAVGERLQLAV